MSISLRHARTARATGTGCSYSTGDDSAHGIAYAPEHDSRRHTLPILRDAARADDGRPREVPALRELPATRSPGGDGAVLSAPRPCLREMLARATAVLRPAGRDLHGVRILFGVFRLVGRACTALRRHDRAAAPALPR